MGACRVRVSSTPSCPRLSYYYFRRCVQDPGLTFVSDKVYKYISFIWRPSSSLSRSGANLALTAAARIQSGKATLNPRHHSWSTLLEFCPRAFNGMIVWIPIVHLFDALMVTVMPLPCRTLSRLLYHQTYDNILRVIGTTGTTFLYIKWPLLR